MFLPPARILIQSIQNILNASLENDPVNADIINDFQPKQLTLHFTDIEQWLSLEFRGDCLRFNQDADWSQGAIHIGFSGKLRRIGSLFSTDNRNHWLPLHHDADALGQSNQAVYDNIYEQLSQLDVNYEQTLAGYIGGFPATVVTKWLRQEYGHQQGFEVWHDSVREYLLYELNAVVESDELPELDAAIASLEKRLPHLS